MGVCLNMFVFVVWVVCVNVGDMRCGLVWLLVLYSELLSVVWLSYG